MTDWTPFIDELGLPVGRYVDGRIDVHDSAQRMGMIGTYFGVHLQDRMINGLRLNLARYETYEGILNRHPNSQMPTTDMTRDNERPLIQAAMIYKNDTLLTRINKKRKYRSWYNWYQSGDVMGPSSSADYVRYYEKGMWARFKIWFGDLDLSFSALIQIFRSYLDHDDVDRTLNIYNTLEFNRVMLETYINRITRFLFSKLVYGGVQYQMDRYFEEEPLDSPNRYAYSYGPPINELVKPVIERYYT